MTRPKITPERLVRRFILEPLGCCPQPRKAHSCVLKKLTTAPSAIPRRPPSSGKSGWCHDEIHRHWHVLDQALQHVIVTAVTQLQPENQRLRHALRVVINYQELSLSNPLITNEHLDALERWMIGKRAAQ